MSKPKNIIKAFTQEMPDGEEWFEKRKSKCDSCEFNTKNSKQDETYGYKSIIADVLNKISPLKVEGEGNCKLCTCFTYRKCSIKEESCPDGRWNALAVSDKHIEIEGKNGVSEITIDANNQYTVKIPDTYIGHIYDIEMSIKPTIKTTKLKRVSVGCGCLMPEVVNNKEGWVDIKLKLSTASKSIADNQTVKLYLYFWNIKSEETSSQITIKFNVKKDEKK